MTIKLNDKEIILHQPLTLEEILLKELNISSDKKGIAIALNDNIIPKHEWKNHTLKDKDEILVIIAAQGG